MRKTTSLLLIPGLIMLASFSGRNGSFIKMKKSDCEELNLKGRIHTICECLFNADVKSDKIFKTDNTPQRYDSTWFDERGNKIDEKIYAVGGNVLTEWSYRYDENENMLEYIYKVKGKQRQRDEYKYDSANRMTEWVRYKGNDSLFEKDNYKYDQGGNQNEQDVEEHFPLKQKLKRFYDFDASGNKIRERDFKLGGSETIVHLWKYDKMGKMIEQDDMNPDGRVRIKTLVTYFNGDQLKERDVQLPDGSISNKDVYTYNAKGSKVEKDYYNSLGKLFHYYILTYDLKGNVRESKEFKIFNDDPPQMEDSDTYELSYDKTGNWVKKTDIKLDGTVTITEREIAYY